MVFERLNLLVHILQILLVRFSLIDFCWQVLDRLAIVLYVFLYLTALISQSYEIFRNILTRIRRCLAEYHLRRGKPENERQGIEEVFAQADILVHNFYSFGSKPKALTLC